MKLRRYLLMPALGIAACTLLAIQTVRTIQASNIDTDIIYIQAMLRHSLKQQDDIIRELMRGRPDTIRFQWNGRV